MSKKKQINTMSRSFERLDEILMKLRAPGGCPWDREQTAKTLIPYLLEETYEVIEAIEDGNPEMLKEELGDLSLHILFQAHLAQDAGDFTMSDALESICDKLVRRHPRVFGEASDINAENEAKSWETIKQSEKKRDKFLDGIPRNLPALTRARRMQEKAANVGFDWTEIEPVWDTVHEEIDELKSAFDGGDIEEIEDELGDVLFSLVNLGRFMNLSAEDALRRTIAKFEHRFHYIEKSLKKQGRTLTESSLEEMDELWIEAKTTKPGKTEST